MFFGVREADALGVARGARRVRDDRDRVRVGHLRGIQLPKLIDIYGIYKYMYVYIHM